MPGGAGGLVQGEPWARCEILDRAPFPSMPQFPVCKMRELASAIFKSPILLLDSLPYVLKGVREGVVGKRDVLPKETGNSCLPASCRYIMNYTLYIMDTYFVSATVLKIYILNLILTLMITLRCSC